MIGERLKLARKKAGLSLRELSVAISGKVSPQAIGKYERNEMMPSSDVLLALCQALQVPVGFMMSAPQVQLSEVDFRKKSSTTAKERAQVEAAVLSWVVPYLQIEQILNLSSATWQAPFEPQRVTSPEQVEVLANQLRQVWHLGEAPLCQLTELLEEKGLKVCATPLPLKVSGLTCLVHDAEQIVPVIVVNAAHNLERRRLTTAHELAHRLLRTEHLTGREEERAANRFASALLMPAAPLRQELGAQRAHLSYPEIRELKHLFQVSAAALVVRLKDLEIISESTMVYLFQTMGRTWRSHEPDGLQDHDQETPRRFSRLCYRALAEDYISVSKAAELLHLSIEQVRQKYNGST